VTTAPRGVTTPTRTLDDFGPISNLAGLSDKEHTVFCSAMWSKANHRLVNFAALGRQLGCSGQWCGKLFQRARVKVSLIVGHDVDLPPYDGLERYDDLQVEPVGGLEWFMSTFDKEEPATPDMPSDARAFFDADLPEAKDIGAGEECPAEAGSFDDSY